MTWVAQGTSQNWTSLNFIENCSQSYRILTSSLDSPKSDIELDTEACWDLARRREIPGPSALRSFCPELNLGSSSDDPIINITWTSKIGKTSYADRYMLEIVKHQNADTSKTCILLQVGNVGVTQKEITMTNIFDCIKLTEERDTFLSAKVWGILTNPGTSDMETVTNIQTKCLNENMIPMSLDFYVPRICHCSDSPTLSLVRLQNGSLQASIWNLPQYAYQIDVYIYETKRYKAVFFKTLTGTTKVNESRSVVTSKKFGPGNYTAMVHAACQGDHDDLHKSGMVCPLMDPVQLSYPLEVTLQPESEQAEVHQTNYYVFIVPTAVLVTGSLCLFIIYILCKRRRKAFIDKYYEMEELLEINTLNSLTNHIDSCETKAKPEAQLICDQNSNELTDKVNKLRNILYDDIK